MKKKKSILLVGLGSEIGSNLISLNLKIFKNFKINCVLTNSIFGNDLQKNLLSLKTRLVLNDPTLTEKIEINHRRSSLIIDKNEIKVFFGDIKTFDIKKISKHFFVTIIATSKKHIGDRLIMQKYSKISDYVLGVAESNSIHSLYPNLIDLNSKLIDKKPVNIKNVTPKVFALGSCQSNGWQAQLRALIDALRIFKKDNYKILGCELDIIHPDTPQGKLGTKSIDPRDQDARNNLRPGFSQASDSMKKLFSSAHLINTVSLRTLVVPPGYQICRFFISCSKKNNLSEENLIRIIKKNSKQKKYIYQFSEIPLGSRAFEQSNSSAIILLDKKYFHVKSLKFLNDFDKNYFEIIFQSYVHNTRGYCISVLETLNKLALNKSDLFCYK